MQVKILKAFALFASVFLLWSAIPTAGKDYQYFITDDDRVFEEMTNGGRFIRPEKIEEAKHAKDSQPADMDREGNWGEATNGCQTSLRFSKTVFSNSEPVVATLIVRNLSEQYKIITFMPDVAGCIVVVGPNGQILQRTDGPKPKDAREAETLARHTKAQRKSLQAGMQRKIQLDLAPYFDFSAAGRYIVYAKPRVVDPESHQANEIQSGNAVIIITNSAPSVTNATTRPGK